MLEAIMNLSEMPTVNPDFYLEKIDDEVLLYSMKKTKAVYLNETASLIWQLCDGSRSIEHIIALLTDAYPQQKAQIQTDVIKAVGTLVEHGAMLLKKN